MLTMNIGHTATAVYEQPPTVYLQFIQNTVYTGPLDVYVDGERNQEGLVFRGATAYVEILTTGKKDGVAGSHEIAVVPKGNSLEDALVTTTLEVKVAHYYTLTILQDTEGEVGIIVVERPQKEGTSPTKVDLVFTHGIADAPILSLRLFEGVSGGGPALSEPIAFGESTSELVSIAPAVYTIELLDAGTLAQLLAVQVDLTGREGQAITILLSGVLNPGSGNPGREATSLVVDAEGGAAQGPIVTGTEEALEEHVPRAYVLENNYPNPFNPTTTIRFSLPDAQYVTLKVYDVTGRARATLFEGRKAAGRHEVSWDATGVPSGTYLYRLQTDHFTETRMLTLIK